MFFSKSLLASVVVGASLALQASAHAIVMPALGVSGTPVRNDVERPSAAKPCGKVDIASTLGATQAITANADGSFTATITNFNPCASFHTFARVQRRGR